MINTTMITEELKALLANNPMPDTLTPADRRRVYRGSTAVVNFLLTSKETNNALSIIDGTAVKGSEPPRHVHEYEDETFIIKEGEMDFYIGDQVIHAKAGDTVFAPRKVPHHFVVKSDYVKNLIVMTPGAFDQYFWYLSAPYDPEKALVPQQQTPEERKKWKDLVNLFGVDFL